MTDTATTVLAPLTSRLAAGEAYRPRTLDALRIADGDLRAVLEGKRHLLFDGGMGTMLQAAGLKAGARARAPQPQRPPGPSSACTPPTSRPARR